jgi:hypothetical protein
MDITSWPHRHVTRSGDSEVKDSIEYGYADDQQNDSRPKGLGFKNCKMR